jgi:hypothetical protein
MGGRFSDKLPVIELYAHRSNGPQYKRDANSQLSLMGSKARSLADIGPAL